MDRIPAAIEEGKRLLDEEPWVMLNPKTLEHRGTIITATEVALAEALWNTHRKYCDEYNWDYNEPPPALIAYTEKIESIRLAPDGGSWTSARFDDNLEIGHRR